MRINCTITMQKNNHEYQWETHPRYGCGHRTIYFSIQAKHFKNNLLFYLISSTNIRLFYDLSKFVWQFRRKYVILQHNNKSYN